MKINGWKIWLTPSTMSSFMNSIGLTTARYDEALIQWNNDYPGSHAAVSMNVRMGSSQYTAGGDAETARTNLINTHGWTITDGGAA